ncbi:uncharacterized protein VTP21DRAFT_10276 [Calcarisporiella thermophila]|uniref:uncharacterized protein n=1 Tax=Calcarisporiella thermophila TaxID=911321 RepID=UPI003743620F
MTETVYSSSNAAEVERLERFVREDTAAEYVIDPQFTPNPNEKNKGEVCRRLSNGQTRCLRMELDPREMFSQMQRLGFFCALPLDPSQTHMECRRV